MLTHSADTPATVPAATSDAPDVVGIAVIEPTHEDVARRAYQLYEERGGEQGRDLEDWFRAERELRQILHDAGARMLATDGVYAAA